MTFTNEAKQKTVIISNVLHALRKSVKSKGKIKWTQLNFFNMKRLHLSTNLICYTVAEYIKAKNVRQNTTARLTNGKWEYLIRNKWVNQQEFNAIRPIPTFKRFNEKGMSIGRYANL